LIPLTKYFDFLRISCHEYVGNISQAFRNGDFSQLVLDISECEPLFTDLGFAVHILCRICPCCCTFDCGNQFHCFRQSLLKAQSWSRFANKIVCQSVCKAFIYFTQKNYLYDSIPILKFSKKIFGYIRKLENYLHIEKSMKILFVNMKLHFLIRKMLIKTLQCLVFFRLGLIHSRHFCTNYCDIALKIYFDFSQLISIEQPR